MDCGLEVEAIGYVPKGKAAKKAVKSKTSARKRK